MKYLNFNKVIVFVILAAVILSGCQTLPVEEQEYFAQVLSIFEHRAEAEAKVKNGYTILAQDRSALYNENFVSIMGSYTDEVIRITTAAKLVNPPPELEDFHEDLVLVLETGNQVFTNTQNIIETKRNASPEDILFLRDYNQSMKAVFDMYIYLYSQFEMRKMNL